MTFKLKKPKKKKPEEPIIDPAEWGYMAELFRNKNFYAALLLMLSWAYLFAGFNPVIIAVILFGTLLVAISIVDLKHMVVPDVVVLPGLAVGLYLMPMFGQHPIAIVLGAMLGFIVFYAIRLGFYKARGYHGMGLGDVKLLAMLGAWCGVAMLPLIVLVSAVSILPVFFVRRVLFNATSEDPLPYGPFLAFGAWVSFLYGTVLWEWIGMIRQGVINLI